MCIRDSFNSTQVFAEFIISLFFYVKNDAAYIYGYCLVHCDDDLNFIYFLIFLWINCFVYDIYEVEPRVLYFF